MTTTTGTRLLRAKALWGPNGKLGAGKTKVNEDFILRDDNDPYVPGTDGTVLRLRPVKLGLRFVAFFERETDEFIEALAKFRDTHPEHVAARTPARRAIAARTSPPARPRTEAPTIKRRPVQSARGR